MLEAVRAVRDQHANAPLHYERFGRRPSSTMSAVELELARSQRVLSVPGNRSALAVMLDGDPTTAYSCQQGFCGTCKVKVLAGRSIAAAAPWRATAKCWSASPGRKVIAW